MSRAAQLPQGTQPPEMPAPLAAASSVGDCWGACGSVAPSPLAPNRVMTRLAISVFLVNVCT